MVYRHVVRRVPFTLSRSGAGKVIGVCYVGWTTVAIATNYYSGSFGRLSVFHYGSLRSYFDTSDSTILPRLQLGVYYGIKDSFTD